MSVNGEGITKISNATIYYRGEEVGLHHPKRMEADAREVMSNPAFWLTPAFSVALHLLHLVAHLDEREMIDVSHTSRNEYARPLPEKKNGVPVRTGVNKNGNGVPIKYIK